MTKAQQQTPQEAGEAAIHGALQVSRYAVNSREYTQFVKGLMLAAGRAWAECKPPPSGAPSLAGRRFGSGR